MTRIAILETGRPSATLQKTHGDYADMFDALLGDGFETTRFDVAAKVLPDAAAFDGVILTGSAAGVYEKHAWLPPLFDWIREARGRTRLLGVCFGHQAMAQALGGRVEKSKRGWGVGLHQYTVVSNEPWMKPPTAIVALPVSHQDQVVEKPQDARVIFESVFTPYAGLAWDRDAISLQAHPEFTPEFTTALVSSREERITPDLVARARDSLTRPNDRLLVAGWLRGFLKG